MLDALQFFGFFLLFLRFSYWIASSLTLLDRKWLMILFSQFVEAVLLFFIFSQLTGKTHIYPMGYGNILVYVGLVLIIIGVFGALSAKRELGKSWIYAVSYYSGRKQKLVTTGIYSFIRHPIYICIVLSYIGAEVLVGSWLWISFCFLFIPMYIQTKKEEAFLIKQYGEKYRIYQKKTNMFLPGMF